MLRSLVSALVGLAFLGMADFEAGSGTVHVVGSLTLDGHRVRCVADIALDSLSGTGRLERLSS